MKAAATSSPGPLIIIFITTTAGNLPHSWSPISAGNSKMLPPESTSLHFHQLLISGKRQHWAVHRRADAACHILIIGKIPYTRRYRWDRLRQRSATDYYFTSRVASAATPLLDAGAGARHDLKTARPFTRLYYRLLATMSPRYFSPHLIARAAIYIGFSADISRFLPHVSHQCLVARTRHTRVAAISLSGRTALLALESPPPVERLLARHSRRCFLFLAFDYFAAAVLSIHAVIGL